MILQHVGSRCAAAQVLSKIHLLEEAFKSLICSTAPNMPTTMKLLWLLIYSLLKGSRLKRNINTQSPISRKAYTTLSLKIDLLGSICTLYKPERSTMNLACRSLDKYWTYLPGWRLRIWWSFKACRMQQQPWRRPKASRRPRGTSLTQSWPACCNKSRHWSRLKSSSGRSAPP